MAKKTTATTADAILDALEATKASASTVGLVGKALKARAEGVPLKAAFGADVVGPVVIGLSWITSNPVENSSHRSLLLWFRKQGFTTVLKDGVEGRKRYVLAFGSHSVEKASKTWRTVIFHLKKFLPAMPREAGNPVLLKFSAWDMGSDAYPARYFPRLGFPGPEINDKGHAAPTVHLADLVGLGVIPNLSHENKEGARFIAAGAKK